MKRKFIDAERQCNYSFQTTGQWWHLYTPGKQCPVILTSAEEFTYTMNLMARCVFETENITVATFEIMDNHIHIVMSGDEHNVIHFFDNFRRRLSRYLSGTGHTLPNEFKPCLKLVQSLQTLRNVIAYVNRNGYVADSDYTPFSYKWGAGRYYFNDFPIDRRVGDLTKNELRLFFRSSDLNIPKDYKIIDSHIAPPSFCDITLGMAMFRDAHHYFYAVSKNVEAYSEIAVELDDSEFLTDQELLARVLQIVREKYRVASTKELTGAQRFELARSLHYDYRSSNGQIRRLLGLNEYDINVLFPLGKQEI